MGDIVRLPTKPRVVYYLELFQDRTDPMTTEEPFKRLGPFERPIAYTHFGTFENGHDDDKIGLSIDDNSAIYYRAQSDDEAGKSMSMVRIVAEVVS